MDCKVCGKPFMLDKSNHYISIDNEVTGISNAIRKEEVNLYDTFDCPHCGCQNVVGERKRRYIQSLQLPSLQLEEEEDE